VVFRILFGSDGSEEILAGLLSSVLDLPEEEYESLAIVDPALKGEVSDKHGILDVRIKTTSGRVLNIEVQLEADTAMRHRVHFYHSRMFCDQIRSGDPYARLQSAISVVITDFCWMDSTAFANHFTYYDPVTCCEFSDVMSIHTLELPKLPDNGAGRLYDWCRFLDARDEDELRGLAGRDPMIGKAVSMLLKLSEDDSVRYLEDMRQKARWREVAREEFVREEGLAAGKAEGRAEGLATGKVEAQVAIARNLRAAGLSPDVIAQSTGLSPEEVEGL
jgi:predicted transposase/invertase (TIGR01784 family)